VDPVVLPFWDIVRSRQVPVLGRRRLHHLTRSPYEAAELIPAPLSQVLSASIVWCGNRPIMILSTVDTRLNFDRFAEWFGYSIRPATPIEVSVLAGTHVQGSTPAGLAWMMPVFIDAVLMQEDALWLSAGDPSIWICLAPPDLQQVTGAFAVDIRLDTEGMRPARGF
jgi:prolyl-tRNA editing enzyme YbaK/EbsC (Cys-tRNA(Pro) deacylase)